VGVLNTSGMIFWAAHFTNHFVKTKLLVLTFCSYGPLTDRYPYTLMHTKLMSAFFWDVAPSCLVYRRYKLRYSAFRLLSGLSLTLKMEAVRPPKCR
jgi:hypothetical protein